MLHLCFASVGPAICTASCSLPASYPHQSSRSRIHALNSLLFNSIQGRNSLTTSELLPIRSSSITKTPNRTLNPLSPHLLLRGTYFLLNTARRLFSRTTWKVHQESGLAANSWRRASTRKALRGPPGAVSPVRISPRGARAHEDVVVRG